MDTKQDWAHFTRRLISKEHDGRHRKRWRERNQQRAPKMHHLAPSTAKDMQLDCPSLSPQEGLNASMNAMPGKCTDALSCGEKRSLTRVTEECSECRTDNRSDWTLLSLTVILRRRLGTIFIMLPLTCLQNICLLKYVIQVAVGRWGNSK